MKHSLRRLSLLLLLAFLLVSLSACFPSFYDWNGSVTAGAGEGENAATTPSEDPGDEPSPPTLSYVLTEEELTAFEAQMALCLELTLAGTDTDAIEAAWERAEEQYYFIMTQSQIAHLLYCCDLSDSAAEADYLTATELQSRASDAYMLTCKAIDDSESPFREEFFSDWSEDELTQMRMYSEEFSALKLENERILVEFRSLDVTENAEEIEQLYLEFAANNNAMAEAFGYEDYYAFASDTVYGRDFDAEMLATMRTCVKEILVPLVPTALFDVQAQMSELSFFESYRLSELMSGEYSAFSESDLQSYFDCFSEEAGSIMESLFRPENSIFTDRSTAQEGAFTFYLYSEDRPFCYFGPGYQDLFTVVHEMGHYYGAHYASMDLISLELAETQSQGNEWLFLSYLEGALDPDIYEALVGYQLYVMLGTVVVSTIVDEFEAYVYANLDTILAEGIDLDDVMAEVCEGYGGVDFLGSYLTDIESYWRYVTIESPVYYISYAISGVAALEFYELAERDFDAALTAYCELIENVDLSKTYFELLSEKGFYTPFEDDPYLAIRERLLGE